MSGRSPMSLIQQSDQTLKAKESTKDFSALPKTAQKPHRKEPACVYAGSGPLRPRSVFK